MNIGYDFENSDDVENIIHGREDTTLTDTIRKHGNRSLVWNWRTGKHLLIDLSTQIAKHESKLCGLHFWIYQKIPADTHLRVTYLNEKDGELSFRVDLSFINWRAVARKIAITKFRQFRGLTKVKFEVENNHQYMHSGRIVFDLIRVSFRCIGWTYDFINSPQIALPYDQRNEIGGIEDLNGIYEINHHWQNMYKWGKIDQNFQDKIDSKTQLSKEENRWTKQLKKVEGRVANWYFPGDKSNYTLIPIAQTKLNSLYDCNIKSCRNRRGKFMKWMDSLSKGNIAYLRKRKFSSRDTDQNICIDNAYKRMEHLSAHGKWPSLFPSRDVLPHGRNDWTGLKFHEVNTRILFPLSLEYFISTRRVQRKHSLYSAGLQSPMTVLQQELKNEPKFFKKINGKNFKTIKKAYKMIYNKRLETIKKLLAYLQQEGWDAGSGLGNTDHLINQNWGFTHSLFLLRNTEGINKTELLKVARWYNEIGEIHQKDFPHTGTTADKLRNLMISRLLIVLSSPMGTITEARQKLLDAYQLKKWIENSLEINEGYGGLIKPDFTAYHHKGPYMSAYTTHALHALSLAAYFLHGTQFQISKTHLNNLKEALQTFYLISNARAVPNSVSGAKVSYNNIKMNHVLPAYAYLSIALSTSPRRLDKDMARIFLKLYKKDDPYLLINLMNGKINGDYSCSCQYFNSIGSIDVFEKVEKLAIHNGFKEADSPTGHWSKNFASLSIHRRKEWVITVKGFSKYIWDYESTVDQNVFGRYQSHGQMLIANGRTSLEKYDIFNGFDWNRIPGTTTVELELDQLRSREKCRYFTKSTTVGSLNYGRRKKKNGIFVMDFQQPQYADDFFKSNTYEFKFKKSFFFFDDLVVCLGSNIHKSGLENKKVITTLFQNKLTGPSSIRVNDSTIGRGNKDDLHITQKETMIILDANNNGYYIPFKSGHKLNMRIGKLNDARQPNGKRVQLPKTYASVVFEHGATPESSSYEYVVLPDSNLKTLRDFSTKFKTNSKPYEVLQQDEAAHVVRFQTEPSVSYTGYTIFNSTLFVGSIANNIIRRVNRPCVIMIKQTSRSVTISVLDPDLRMFDDPLLSSRNIQKDLLYKSHSKKAWLEMSFNHNLKLIHRKKSNKVLKNSIAKRLVGGFRSHIRLLLSHGLTSELKFEILRKKK